MRGPDMKDGSFSTCKGTTHWQSYDAGLAGEAFVWLPGKKVWEL